MKLSQNIFSIILSVAVTTAAVAGDIDCRNATYRRAHPSYCQNFESDKTSKTVLALAGGAAMVGLGFALAQNSSGDHGSSSSISNQNTILRSANADIAYSQSDIVQNQRIASTYLDSLTNGSDIDAKTIKQIKKSDFYAKNAHQMDRIKYAWAIARGFTGKNSQIAILDDFNSYHGLAVYDLAKNVAPDAQINTYNLTNSADSFVSYNQIANVMANAESANIYNNSWQIYATESRNAATVIYDGTNTKTYAAAQSYLYDLTSQNFVNQIINSAVDNDSIFVWAAGNESLSESGALSALPLAFPELQGHFVNVVALDATNKIAWFSNQCGITQNYCISAPGSSLQTEASTNKVNGTSFAAPIVSSAIAVIKEAFPYMQSTKITELLFVTAQDLGDAGIDSVYGWGLLDLEKATQPVGTPKIVLSDDSVQPLNETVVSGIAASAIKNAGVKMAFVDDFGRAFTTNLSDNVRVKPYGRGFDKLQESENNSVVLFDTFEFGVQQSHLLESNGLLSTKSNNLMNFIGYKNEFDIGDVKFYQNIRAGMSLPQANENSVISGFSNVYTATIKTGVKWNDFSFEFAVPDMIMRGNMYMNLLSGRESDGHFVYKKANIDLSTKPSTEYTVKYKSLLAGFVNNPDYANEIFVMFKTKKSF